MSRRFQVHAVAALRAVVLGQRAPDAHTRVAGGVDQAEVAFEGKVAKLVVVQHRDRCLVGGARGTEHAGALPVGAKHRPRVIGAARVEVIHQHRGNRNRRATDIDSPEVALVFENQHSGLARVQRQAKDGGLVDLGHRHGDGLLQMRARRHGGRERTGIYRLAQDVRAPLHRDLVVENVGKVLVVNRQRARRHRALV